LGEALGAAVVLTRIGRYVRRKWRFLLLVAVLLALNVWVWRLALMPTPQPLAPTTAAHEARAPMWLSWLILAVYVVGWFYVVGKGWPILLREFGWARDDEH
jgi:hypothetical protein